jgi:phytoene dehydrogenase-like protein
MKTSENTFDVIIIGSGIGGLTSASLLAQMEGKRVLILEQHFKLGGFTHTFKRQGIYEWDVGLHYIGGMAKGRMNRTLFDYITRGQVDWFEMPDPFEVFVYPDFTFSQRVGMNNFKSDLLEMFPQERKAIETYFNDLMEIGGWFQRYLTARALPHSLQPVSDLLNGPGSHKALQTTKEYLDTLTDDLKLKALLASQWGDYGLPPSQSAFAIHASLVTHYFEGGFFPIGGSSTIAASIIPIIEENGGQALINHRVDEIIVQDGKAIGVKVSHLKGKQEIEKTFYADLILSNAGNHITYTRLLPPSTELPFRQELERMTPGSTTVTLNLGFKEDPRLLGFQGENYWIYSSYDHEQTYARKDDLVKGQPVHCFLSFPSLKNPLSKGHTAEIIAGVSYQPFAPWVDKPWQKRGEDYETLKKNISLALIHYVEQHFPGIENLVDYAELSTPLSTIHFTGHHKGSIYGMPATPERYRAHWISPQTPFENFYIIGSDAGSHGIIGALMSSAVTTSTLMKGSRGVREFMRAAIKFSRQQGQ